VISKPCSLQVAARAEDNESAAFKGLQPFCNPNGCNAPDPAGRGGRTDERSRRSAHLRAILDTRWTRPGVTHNPKVEPVPNRSACPFHVQHQQIGVHPSRLVRPQSGESSSARIRPESCAAPVTGRCAPTRPGHLFWPASHPREVRIHRQRRRRMLGFRGGRGGAQCTRLRLIQ
jgi:hypothetical protein